MAVGTAQTTPTSVAVAPRAATCCDTLSCTNYTFASHLHSHACACACACAYVVSMAIGARCVLGAARHWCRYCCHCECDIGTNARGRRGAGICSALAPSIHVMNTVQATASQEEATQQEA